MNRLKEKGMLKALMGQKLGLLNQTAGQVVNAKEKSLKKIKNATSMSIQITIKWDILVADKEKVWVV